MSSISSVGSGYSNYSAMSSSTSSTTGARGHHRPDPAKMASDLFSQLDTSNKGYIEKSDLQSALDQVSGSSNASATSSTSNSNSADALFSKLDGDGDGKVTQDEMSTGLKQLADQLDSQFNQMRMQGSGGAGEMHGKAPPPPPENDAGFSQDELTSQLNEIGSSDSQRSSLISNIVNNFSEADTNGDGKVNAKEAMAYDKASQSSSSSSGTTNSSNSTDSASSDLQVMKQIMELMKAYGQQDNQSQAQNSFSQISSLLSVTV